MKSEFIKVKGRGVCILISDISPNIFVDGSLNIIEHLRIDSPFSNVHAVADEIRIERKIAAIKEIRHQTGWGLKESKNYIDKYIPMGYGDDNFSFDTAADKFIRDHTYILEGDFIADGEMEIL